MNRLHARFGGCRYRRVLFACLLLTLATLGTAQEFRPASAGEGTP